MMQPIYTIFNNLKYKEKFCHRVIKILLGVSFTLAMLLMLPDHRLLYKEQTVETRYVFYSKFQKVSYCCTSLFL